MKMNELRKLKKLKLTDPEKKELFMRISNCISQDNSEIKFQYPTLSPFFRFSFLLQSKRYLQVGVLSVLLVLISSATAFASLNTLPGDLLYGVKTNIVEKIPLLWHVSLESRVEDNYEKIEKRINEFEKLAEKGRLTEENTKKIEKNIDENFSNFDQNIRRMKENGQKELKDTDKLEMRLESNLKKHAERIERIRQDEKVKNKQVLQSVIERAYFSDNKTKKTKDDSKIENLDL